MKNGSRLWVTALLLIWGSTDVTAQPEVRVAVAGGLELSGTWQQVETAAERALGIAVTTILAAPKEQVVPAFMRGEADLLLIHGGDETFALQALGYSTPLRTWGYNAFAFVGPVNDPAGIAQAATGREAIRRIQETAAPLIAFRDPGSYNILQCLLDQAGLIPAQLRLLPDAMPRPQQVLQQAARDDAYVLVGHIPVAFGKMSAPGIKLLFTGDPAMRRAYVIATPGPQHPADNEERENAERLAAFLLSPAGQEILGQSSAPDGEPWIYPKEEADIPLRRSTAR